MEKFVVTTGEAAELLSTSRNTMIRLLECGDIPAYKEGTHWKIPTRLLMSYAESRAIAEAKERASIAREMKNDN